MHVVWRNPFRRLLIRLYIKLKRIEDGGIYCVRCGACGYHECCPASMCRGGWLCHGYYRNGEDLMGPIEQVRYVVPLERED